MYLIQFHELYYKNSDALVCVMNKKNELFQHNPDIGRQTTVVLSHEFYLVFCPFLFCFATMCQLYVLCI